MSLKEPTQYSTSIELLRWRAAHQGDRHAYTFLVDGKKEGMSLTYGELDRYARAIAAQLQSLNAYGERALLLYPAGLEVLCAFFGCLYAGVIAIPAPPPEASRLKRTLPRLQAIARDAQASLVLTTAKIIDLVGEFREQLPELHAMRWLPTEETNLEQADQWQDPQITPDVLAYLQYTSGSTSTPKGVMISHHNIVHHTDYLQRACEYNADSVTVSWMPYFHDYGLVEGLLAPLYNGTPCYVMSPVAFIKQPFHWLNAISRFKGTHTQAPNFAYDLCLRRIKPQQREQLDLSSWRAAGNAAEPINPKVLDSFIQTFAECGFRPETFAPAYGLAETTLLVSSSPHDAAPLVAYLEADALEKNRIVEATNSSGLVRTVAGCGRLVCETRVEIVNPNTLTRCQNDEVGEIWVSDPGVAQGYWQRPEETERTFAARLADTGEGPFFRTGDLGFLKDGELYITGRIKDVVIIRGTNHYPQDIEWTVQQVDPALRPNEGAVFSVQVDGEEQLVIAQEVERHSLQELDVDRLIESIREAVAEQHEIATYGVVLLKRGSLLKTASGKIQRSACRQGFLDGSLEVVASWVAHKNPPQESTITPLSKSLVQAG
jgi:acyl-CoA synthetase (AMP-forming)/AMP-acid ligase II